MANVKDKIEIPGKKKTQGWLIGIGVLSCLIAFGSAKNGDGKAMLIYGAIGVGLIYVGAKIKTTKDLKGTVGIYR